MGGMRFPEEVTDDVTLRLRRLEGQIRGIQRMLAEGQECEAVVTQLAAAKAALDRVSFRLVAAGMRYCITNGGGDGDTDQEGAVDLTEVGGIDADGKPADAPMEVSDLEKLFLKLS